MEKIIIDVPRNIRYISEWDNFAFSNFYSQHVIINKQITGCGFTEYALRCSEPVVLCSPRKMLMQNKKDQHGDRIFLVVNDELEKITTASLEFDPTEKDNDRVGEKLNNKDELDQKQLKEYKDTLEESIYLRIKNDLYTYLQSLPLGISPKIIVTYDSSYIIYRILENWGIVDNYYFVVDEFQSILDDARFKAGTEIEFLNVLKNIRNVLYVSATPMLDKYIEMLDQFNTLTYYQLDWGKLDPNRVRKPTLKVRGFKSFIKTARDIIISYLQGNFEKVVLEREGQLVEVESKEAVVYVNSVNHIIKIIKDLSLTSDQVNILCSNTPENRKKLRTKLGKDFEVGSVPTYGEQHKMFTFCTRTVYLGADFYSTNARSFIFSDANSDCLSVDISMDLPQILGRQRLDINPWKNSAEFYFRSTCDYKKMTLDDLMKIIEKKEKATHNLLNLWAKGTEEEKYDSAQTYLDSARSRKYKNNYVSVDRKSENILLPVFNNLVKVNELRTFEIQQVDYANRFTVFTTLENRNQGFSYGEEEGIAQFFKLYSDLSTYLDRIKFICEFILEFPEYKNSIILNLSETDKIRQQLVSLGPERIKSLGYNYTRINEAMSVTIFDQRILNSEIYSRFKEGEKWTNANIKNILSEIYEEVGYKKTAKANDIENWFEVRTCQISRKEGTRLKRDSGYELLKSKQDLDLPNKYLE